MLSAYKSDYLQSWCLPSAEISFFSQHHLSILLPPLWCFWASLRLCRMVCHPVSTFSPMFHPSSHHYWKIWATSWNWTGRWDRGRNRPNPVQRQEYWRSVNDRDGWACIAETSSSPQSCVIATTSTTDACCLLDLAVSTHSSHCRRLLMNPLWPTLHQRQYLLALH